MSQRPGELTLLLSNTNNPESLRMAMQLAYEELHRMAASHFRNERPDHTWQATALLHEACIGLLEKGGSFKNRKYFFGAASRKMRRLLLDGARRRKAQKRGGGWNRIDFDEAFNEGREIGFEQADDLVDFDAALSRLTAGHPLLGEMAELRVFGGWSTTETATILGIAPSTARQRWTLAKRYLRQALSSARR